MTHEKSQHVSDPLSSDRGSDAKLLLVLPVFETAILLGSVAFVLGIVIPFIYAHETMRPHLVPLPAYLRWVDMYDHRLLACVAIALPASVLLFGLVANHAFPNRIRRYFPWWKTSLQSVLHKNRIECNG
ncbi:hypothetical protein [Novipirellula caenicola]|uniref:Uncharacterized protein n=1 Tax=Novipirellula caenicola TaxID=1536901 RepID=A0ABP9VWA6_9BACT